MRWGRIVLRFGGRQFRPRLVPTLATLALFPILVWLGIWQLHRADEKRAIENMYAQRTAQSPLHLGAQIENAEQIHYRRVIVTGRYDEAHQFLLDNKVYQGRAGYDVITPLQLQDSDTWVLVNRGWIPQGNSREDLPDLETPAGTVTITGLAEMPPAKGVFMGDQNRENSGWPAVVLWLDLQHVAAQTGRALQPVVVLQDPGDPGAFVRHWTLVVMPPEKSVSYAVQWFSMALALLIIFVVVNLKRIEETPGAESRRD